MRLASFLAVSSLPFFAFACSSTSGGAQPGTDAGGGGDSAVTTDGGDASAPVGCSGPCPASKVKYLVVIVQENHTFDNHFGAYCKAAAGSNPTCNDGPMCCEAVPATEPGGAMPQTLDDTEMLTHDPDHSSTCESSETNGGMMDKYVTGAACSDVHHFAVAGSALVKPYWDFATAGAIGDRYFQSLVGQSSANDMYLARAQFVFLDNQYGPMGATGLTCGISVRNKSYTDKTIGDLLTTAGVPWAWYMEGYKVMADAVAATTCPDAPADCSAKLSTYPCAFDPSDNPFEYYDSTRDKPEHLKDYAKLSDDLAAASLPAVTFVKGLGYRSEHPGNQVKLSDGVAFVQSVVAKVQASKYAADTLVIVTWDEGGGYFDHVAPPPTNTADMQPYGTRVPLIAIGPFAKKNYVSHVVMEHSSLVKFIEWNWLGKTTGQLMGRDVNVNNIGSVLDPAATGEKVPE